MCGYALAFMENLDRRGRGAHLHQLLIQVIRNAVIVRTEGDLLIDVDPCP
jgi:hypothetical protein